MNVYLHDQLTQALLAEMASGYYHQGDRFLSHRKICQQWKVSDTTAEKSIHWLQRNHLIEAKARSGNLLLSGFRHRALLLLHQRNISGLPADATWRTKRFSLARGQTNVYRIACIFSGKVHMEVSSKIPTYFDESETQCAQGFFAKAQESGSRVEFYVHNEKPEGFQYVIEQILRNPPDGVAVFRRGFFSNLSPMINPLVAARIPVVTVFDDCNQTDVLSVTINNVALGYEVARRFISHGHRRIAVLIQDEPFDYFTDRFEGCRLAIEEKGNGGIALEKLVMPASRQVPRRLLKLFKSPEMRPTALLATRVDLFERLLPSLKRLGVRIPGDLSVVTVLGKQTSKLKLDCMFIDFHRMGALAMEKLQGLIEGSVTDRSVVQRADYLRAGTLERYQRGGERS